MSSFDDQTKLIHVETGEYPVTVAQLRRRHKEWFMGPEVPEYVIITCGYAVVAATEAPVGDVVTEGQPSGNVTDGYFQTWDVRAFTAEELAGQLETARDKALRMIFSVSGAAREFGAPYTIGSGVQHVQLREKDISNLTGLATKAGRDPARTYYFRSRENIVNPMTSAEVTALTDFAFDEFEILLEKTWGLEEQTKTALTIAEVPTEAQIKAALHYE